MNINNLQVDNVEDCKKIRDMYKATQRLYDSLKGRANLLEAENKSLKEQLQNQNTQQSMLMQNMNTLQQQNQQTMMQYNTLHK